MARKIGAVIAGVLVLGVVVAALQFVSASIHPLPEGVDPFDPEDAAAFAEHLEGMPDSAWMVAFASELIGAFFGALVAGAIVHDRKRMFSAIIVGLALVGSVANWLSFAHPTWFIVGQLLVYPAVLAGVWGVLARKRPTTQG